MGQRGPRSVSEIQTLSVVQRVDRPNPPSELTDEQANEWLSVVEGEPADWFPQGTHGLLAQYCRHRVAARRVAQMVSAAEAEDAIDVVKMDRLYKMQEREGRAISSLATRMRITQQATVNPKTRKTVDMKMKKPWQD